MGLEVFKASLPHSFSLSKGHPANRENGDVDILRIRFSYYEAMSDRVACYVFDTS